VWKVDTLELYRACKGKFSFFNYKSLLLSFFLTHLVLIVLFGEYIQVGTSLYNFVHKIELFKHPELWTNDLIGSFGNLKYHFMLSLGNWIPALVHIVTGISLKLLSLLEVLVKPCLFLYMVALILKSTSDEKRGNYEIVLLLLAYKGFKILGLNLNLYNFLAYENYNSEWYHMLFLVGLLSIYRRRWNVLALVMFLGPMAHASLGCVGNALLLVLAFSHDITKTHLKKAIFFFVLGSISEVSIVKFVTYGTEKIPNELLWEAVTRNGHLYPDLLKKPLTGHLIFTFSFFAVAYIVSNSERLKKDLLISFAFVLGSIIFYSLFVVTKFVIGLQLAVMRCSVFVIFLGFINLGNMDVDSASLKDKILLVLLVAFSVLYREEIGAFTTSQSILLLCAVFIAAASIIRLKLRKTIILFLLIPFLMWPVRFFWRSYEKNRPMLEMFSDISKKIPKGSVFLLWDRNISISNRSRFRSYTKSQIITVQVLQTSLVYSGSKEMFEDEVKKAECVLGRKVKVSNHLELNPELKEALNHELKYEQLKRFKKQYNVQYVLYPSTKRKMPLFKFTVVYEGAGYKILKV